MAEDPLHDIIEAVRARLKAELETQLRTVSERHQQSLDETRVQIEAEAEQRWGGQLEAARAELDQLEQTLKSVEAERDQQIDTHAAAGTSTGGTDPGSLLRGLRDIDAASSITDSLAALARAAASSAPRAALFLANGSLLEQWPVEGVTPLASGPLDINDPDAGIAVQSLKGGEAVHTDGSACAIPLVLDGSAVGVLYAEVDADGDAAPDWTERFEVVARHGAARLGYLTALRTAQARTWLAESTSVRTAAASSTFIGGAPGTPPGGLHSLALRSGRFQYSPDQADIAASARRYARLVVSEIKLYNESAVQEGRSRRDLLARLGPEIERARRLYEERVPASVAARSENFQQELIQTLAGGDPSLLG